MLSVRKLTLYVGCHYAECNYAACLYGESRGTIGLSAHIVHWKALPGTNNLVYFSTEQVKKKKKTVLCPWTPSKEDEHLPSSQDFDDGVKLRAVANH